MSGEYEMAWTELTAEQVLINQKQHKNSLRRNKRRIVSKHRTKKKGKEKAKKHKFVAKRQEAIEIKPMHQPSKCKIYTHEEIEGLNK